MSIFADEIEEWVGAEAIEGIVVGFYGGHDWLQDDDPDDEWRGPRPQLPKELRGKLLTWPEVRPYLAYEWDTSFGGASCHPVYIWTATRVAWIHEYDGSTGLAWMPRNPIDVLPHLSGADDD